MALNSPLASPQQLPRRNAGPRWGFAFLCRLDRMLPRWLLQPLLELGTWVAVWRMPAERGYSRQYLSAILGRNPTRVEVWRHFFAFTEMFMLRLRVANGQPHLCLPQPGCAEFETLMRSRRPALLGTFHIGNSDLLGFQLNYYQRTVHMIRLRVENSADTERLAAQFGKWVTYIWVNDPENMLFALKDAAQRGSSIALKCDRPDYSAKREAFYFLGAPRDFPFTIYHLALMFRLPVVFSFSVPGPDEKSLLYSSPVLEILEFESRADYLPRARRHFQGVLDQVEDVLRENPTWWFNFTPLNPVADSVAQPVPATALA